MLESSPQPNLVAEENTHRLPLKFWGLLVITGTGAGLGGAGLMAILRLVQHLFWLYRTGDFLSAVQHVSDARRFTVLLIGGVVSGIGLFVRQNKIGGHGGEVSEAIWFKGGKLPFLRTSFSAVLSMVIVGLGASVGREGAPKQIGAAIASKLSEWVNLSPAQVRLLAACGAGAGMGAVYNVPLGGALFAMEVLLGTLAFPMVLPAILTSLIAVFVSWIYLPIRATYIVPPFHVSTSEIVWALLFGPAAGLASVVYVRAIVWADRGKPRGWHTVANPITAFALLGLLAMKYPQVLGNGKDTAQLAFFDMLGWKLLLALTILKVVATAGCLRSGVPGGLFTPTVTVGATLGGLAGHFWSHLGFGMPSGSYAIIGAAALLAAATQGPVSAIALMVELTHNINGVLVPLMLAVAGATITARWLEPRSIYTARIRLGKSAAAEDAPAVRTGFDELISQDFNVVSAAEHYSMLLKTMLSARSAEVCVADERGRYLGMISVEAATDPNLDAPLDTTTALDLLTHVPPLTADMAYSEVVGRRNQANGNSLPVVDGSSGKVIGVVKGSA